MAMVEVNEKEQALLTQAREQAAREEAQRLAREENEKKKRLDYYNTEKASNTKKQQDTYAMAIAVVMIDKMFSLKTREVEVKSEFGDYKYNMYSVVFKVMGNVDYHINCEDHYVKETGSRFRGHYELRYKIDFGLAESRRVYATAASVVKKVKELVIRREATIALQQKIRSNKDTAMEYVKIMFPSAHLEHQEGYTVQKPHPYTRPTRIHVKTEHGKISLGYSVVDGVVNLSIAAVDVKKEIEAQIFKLLGSTL